MRSEENKSGKDLLLLKCTELLLISQVPFHSCKMVTTRNCTYTMNIYLAYVYRKKSEVDIEHSSWVGEADLAENCFPAG